MATDTELLIKITGTPEHYERALKHAEKATTDFQKKIETGATISANAATPLIQRFEMLRRTIISTYGSLDAATPEAVANLRKIEAEMRSAVRITQELDRATKSQMYEFRGWAPIIQENSSRFGQLGSAVTGLAANLALVAIAWKQVKLVADEAIQGPLGEEGKEALKKWGADLRDEFRNRQDTKRREAYDQLVGGALWLKGAINSDWSDFRAQDPSSWFSSSGRVTGRDFVGPRATDAQKLQAAAVTSNRLREEEEIARKKAEALAREAAAQQRLAEVERLRNDALREANPFQKAELEYLADVVAARGAATAALRAERLERADLDRQMKVDAAFTDLLSNGRTFGDLASKVFTGAEWTDKFGVAEREQIAADLEADMLRLEMDEDRRQQQLERAIEKWRAVGETVAMRLSDAATDLALNGGDNLGRIAANRFTDLTKAGFDEIFKGLANVLNGGSFFGGGAMPTQNEKDGKWYLPGGSFGYASEADAVKAQRQRLQQVNAAMDFAAIGVGAYGAARGGEGTRTGSLISGGVSGASIGGQFGGPGAAAVGAVIGAIAGAIGGYFGEQQRQSEYKYGIPYINPGNGVAGIYGTKNLQPAEIDQLTSRVQETYDFHRNSWAKILLRDPAASFPAASRIEGKFQPEPSANWGKHFEQWISGTLGDVVASQFRPHAEKVYERVGIDKARFGEFESEFNRLDPKKAMSLWTELYDSMASITETMAFFGKSNPFGQNTSFFGNMADERARQNRSMGTIMSEDYFQPILEISRGLDVLTGEERIHNLAEIARMQREAESAQKEAIREIIQISDAAVLRKQSAIDNLELIGMRNEDGTTDFGRQGEYLKGMADRELRKIQNAKTAAEAQQAYEAFVSITSQLGAMGYNISEETGEAWRKWAINAVNQGESELQKQLQKLGTGLTTANEEFIKQFDPIIKNFTTAGDAADKIGGRFDGAGGKIDDIIPRLDGLGLSASNATAEFERVAEALRKIGGGDPVPGPDVGGGKTNSQNRAASQSNVLRFTPRGEGAPPQLGRASAPYEMVQSLAGAAGSEEMLALLRSILDRLDRVETNTAFLEAVAAHTGDTATATERTVQQLAAGGEVSRQAAFAAYTRGTR